MNSARDILNQEMVSESDITGRIILPYYHEFRPIANVNPGLANFVPIRDTNSSNRLFWATGFGFCTSLVGVPLSGQLFRIGITDIGRNNTFQKTRFNPTAVIGTDPAFGNQPYVKFPVPYPFDLTANILVEFENIDVLPCTPELVLVGYLADPTKEAIAINQIPYYHSLIPPAPVAPGIAVPIPDTNTSGKVFWTTGFGFTSSPVGLPVRGQRFRIGIRDTGSNASLQKTRFNATAVVGSDPYTNDHVYHKFPSPYPIKVNGTIVVEVENIDLIACTPEIVLVGYLEG